MFFDWLERMAGKWRLRVRRPLDQLAGVVHGGLLFGATVLFGILGYSSQGRELFRVLLEQIDPVQIDPVQITIGALATILLSGLLFFTYRSFLPNLGQDTQNDSWMLRSVAGLGLYGIAAAPFLSSMASVWGMWSDVRESLKMLDVLVSDAGMPAVTKQSNSAIQGLKDIDRLAQPTLLAIAGLGCLTLLLLWFLTRRGSKQLSLAGSTVFNGLAAIVIIVLGLYAALSDTTFVGFYRDIGSLAAGLLCAISLFVIGLAVSGFARAAGLKFYVASVLVAGIYFAGAKVSGMFFGEPTLDPSQELAKAKPTKFEKAVDAWITDREASVPAPGRVPMLVVSAQGGGIYAAIASSLFLARLQGAEPKFNSSVLAISAVSGGSIGASLYTTLTGPKGCKTAAATPRGGGAGGGLEMEISRVLLGAHLAPIVGNVATDLLRKLPPVVFFATTDRAGAFKESLILNCPGLDQTFVSDWTVAGRIPALVLNTTWMTHGHRVAFAPFTFDTRHTDHNGKTGDGTLWSFDDFFARSTPHRNGLPFKPTLADAAVTSARFPGVLPPLSLIAGAKRFNYGDGGYADASGVTTALDLFEKASLIAKKRNSRVDPLLVMLTFDYKPVLPESEDARDAGTSFVDTIAPLEAILGVRSNLTGKAITRAETLYANSAPEQPGILRVTLNPDDYKLALGLQLSRTSYNILSLLIGRPEWCSDMAYAGSNAIMKNSCAARKVLRAVRGGR